MEAVAVSVIAVLGTLIGAGSTYYFQRKAQERSEAFTRVERLRQERIDAFSAYAGALLNYRRVLVFRWFVLHEGRFAEDTPALLNETYTKRYAAQEAMFRAQLVGNSPALTALAEEAMAQITVLHRIESRAELDEARDRTRQCIRDLVSAVAPHVG
ncbi:hypothetical protein [Streptomyces sp. NPDC050738]|uniref:hypothetical protein n=1 Tax=Streptomyces sp. NPDC050738 TaxID=3154744 RepID=UPI00343963C8